MGELYYTNRKFFFDSTRGKWRGKIYHWSNGKRQHKVKTFEEGKQASKQRYLEWCDTEETKAQLAKRGGNLAESTLVADYVTAYVDTKERTKAIEASTVKTYRTSARYIREGLGEIPLCDLKASEVEKWLERMTAKGYSASTIGKAFRLLKQALKDAVNSEAILRNPCDTVKPPKRANKNPGINSLDAQARGDLLGKLDALALSPVSVAARIALYTGLRRGEVCGLQWRDLDAKNKVLWVRRAVSIGKGGTYVKQPKTDKPRDVALPDTLLAILAQWKEQQRGDYADKLATLREDSYIVGDALGYLSPTRLTKEWAALARLCGVRGVEGRLPSFHDLRHTWATMFLASGGDVKTAASNLGHANAAMTLNIYASADPDAKKRAAEITERAMRPTKESHTSAA